MFKNVNTDNDFMRRIFVIEKKYELVKENVVL